LDINEEKSERTKVRYQFLHGDCEEVDRCGVLSAESTMILTPLWAITLAAESVHRQTIFYVND
jgi:hypothetical protein